MAVQITADRVRSLISGCRYEHQVLAILKYHKIRFRQVPYSEGYMLNLHIPCRTGIIRIYRSCSRRSPFVVQHMTPVTFTPSAVPVFRPSIPYGSPYNGI